jgi:uncharacterized protein YggU (UPF0235/DUF167 family)
VSTLNVRVIPRARKTECAGFRDDVLVVRVAAPFFSSSFHVPRRAVHIVSGDRGRQKRIAIESVTREQIPWSRIS